jgi:glutamate--cysteine ligase
MRLGNILGLLLASWLDNTTHWAGRPYTGINARLHIWNDCDLDRCCQRYGAFEKDFGYAAYADYLLSVPPIFLDGRPTGRKTLGELAHEKNRATADHLMSMVFPFVRAKHYLEIRTLDSLPAPYDRAAVAFFKGIFSDPITVSALAGRYGAVTEEVFDRLNRDLLRTRDPQFLGAPLSSHLDELIPLAEKGLMEAEKQELAPLKALDRPLVEVLGRELAQRVVI